MPVSIGLLGRQAPAAIAAGTMFGARLIAPGAVATSFLAPSRAQASGISATAIGTDAETWLSYAADVPRFTGAARRYLAEGQRTNSIRNARFDGAVSGVISSGGGAGTNMVVSAVAGLTVTLTAGIQEDGLDCIDIEYVGTHAGGVANLIFYETVSGIGATSGDSFVAGHFVSLVSGTLTNVAFTTLMQFVGGTTAGSGTITPAVAALGTQRWSAGFTAGAGTTAARPGLRATFTAGAVNCKIRIGYPACSSASFLSSPILPPIGVPGAATRGPDRLSGNFPTLFPDGVGTVLGTVMIPQNAPSGIDQTIFEAHLGNANDRMRLRNVAGGATVVLGRTIAGSASDATSLGSMTAGTAFKFGVAFDGTTLTGNFNGGANQTVAGQPSGLTSLAVGTDWNGDNALFGEVAYFDVLPYAIPGANLPAAVSALPS